MAEMRKCKECGKLFLPKGREQYCSNDHYRPCPICGVPVIVKYLSDPPRKCDSCRHKKSKPATTEPISHSKSLFNFTPQDSNKEADTKEIQSTVLTSTEDSWVNRVDTRIPDTVVDRKEFCNLITGDSFIYVGPEIKNGFTKGHEYMLQLEIHDQVYWAKGVEDRTLDKDVTIVIPYTSQRSFYQNFARVKE